MPLLARPTAVCALVAAGVMAGCLDDRLAAEERPQLPTSSASVREDGGGGVRDAGADRAASGRCSPTAPFGAPRRVAELSDPIRNEWVFRRLADEQHGLLARQDNEGSRILSFALRADGFWSSPLPVEGPWGTFVGDPFVTSIDGKERLFFTEQVSGLSTMHLVDWDAAKSAATGTAETIFTTTFNDVSPTFVSSSNELWFMRDAGTGAFRLHRSVRAAGAFGTPELDPVLSSSDFEANGAAAFSPDGLTVFFGGRAIGSQSDIDIYSARRRDFGAPFETVVLEAELSSGAFDQPLSLGADGCNLYLSSGRQGSIDIYFAERGK